MNNPEKHKRQMTIVVIDSDGNRLHIPVNMGFGYKFWVRIMSEAIIGAALKIELASWPQNLRISTKLLTLTRVLFLEKPPPVRLIQYYQPSSSGRCLS